MEQALSPPSCADGAAHAEVPARDAGDLDGTKTMEVMDQISRAKLASTIDEELPPLHSMIIDGLPPLQQSKYVNEAEKHLLEYVERYPNAISLGPYCRVGLSVGSYMHPGVINVERLVVISLNYAILFLVDDLFFDTRDESFEDQYGISYSTCGGSEKIQEYLNHLHAIFKQQEQPSNSALLLETLVWELGRDTLGLSNPEWFNHFATCLMEYYCSSVDSHKDIVQGHNLCVQDLDSYIDMRIGNSGASFAQMLVEFASDTYIPSVLRANPYVKDLTTTTCIHIAFANDVFSYHKESKLEQNPRNLITILMKSEGGKPFAQIVQMAIDLTNTYARVIMDFESQAWNSILQNHLQDIIALVAGNVYFHVMDTRYRHPDSMFLELRDTTSSWKIPLYIV